MTVVGPHSALRNPDREILASELLHRYSLARNVTPTRLKNLRSACAAFIRGDAETGAYPYSLFVEASNRCNLGCPLCPTGANMLGRKPESMALPTYRRLIDEVGPYAFEVHYAFFGEPTLHPDLPEMIEYAARRSLTTRLMTNGTRVNDARAQEMVRAGLDRVTISLDGLDQASYETYRRNGDVGDVLRSITAFAAARRDGRPWIEVQLLALRTNEDQLPRAARFVADLGANELKIKRASFDLVPLSGSVRSSFLPRRDTLHYYDTEDRGALRYRFRGNEHELPACQAMYLEPGIVTASGETALCCRDPGALYSYGDFARQSFRDCWDGALMQRFREAFRDRARRLPICRDCPNLSLTTFQAVSRPLVCGSETVDA